MTAAALLALVGGAAASAQGTKLWTQSRFEELEKGTPQGVEISSDGKLRAGPVASEVVTTPSSFVWSVAVGKDGVAYLATGAPATVLRVAPEGKSTKLFETRALAVQVVRLGPDGALYAATIPDGRVYRIKTDAVTVADETTAEVVFDLGKLDAAAGKADDRKIDGKARYIWDMTFDSAGRLYVATGGPGMVYRLDVRKAGAAAEAFFKTDEQHIRVLAWDKAGNLIAGTDGSGLVYRITPNGKGYVLWSAPRREIPALAVGADGTIYAATVGDKSRNPLPQLPVQAGSGGITITFVNPGSVQAANASTTLPEGSEIYALRSDEAPRKVWSGKDEIVYQLAASSEGLTALTGNRGRVFTIHADGTAGDIAHVEAQQAVAMAAVPGAWLVGTANTGKLYRIAAGGGKEAHSYASDVLDAGAMTRWGRVEVEPGSRGYEVWTRSGNVEQPVRSARNVGGDWGWSDWQQTEDGKVVSPAGRYLQWKVVLGEGGVVAGVGVNYLPVNAAPVVDEVVVVPGARVVAQAVAAGQAATVSIAFASGTQGNVNFDGNAGAAAGPIQAQKDRTAVTVRWAAHDDNGDDMLYDLYLRGDGEHEWRLLKKGLTEKVFSFDGATLPDGGYRMRVVATDAPSHAPGAALTGELVSDRFELDTTAPVIAGLKAGSAPCAAPPCAKTPSLRVSFEAKDAASAVAHAEYSVDAGPWVYLEPVGGLSDAREERYEVSVPLPAGSDGATEPEHLVTVRVYDRHENMAVAKVVVGSSEVK